MTPDPGATLAQTAAALRTWLADNADELAPYRHEPEGDIRQAHEATRPLQALLFDAGWTRLGWPEAAGGIGGRDEQRAVVLEGLAAAGYALPEAFSSLEVIGPMLVAFAPGLAAECLPLALRGDEVWCQGFSEPDAGSDLTSLRTRAVAGDGGFRLTGQKMWSSLGTASARSCVLARTGEPGHRGLTLFWVDLDQPGISVRPTWCETGRDETAELFLDDVFVPTDRLIGPVGGGWGAVMFLMQYERGAYAWKRQAELHTELEQLLDGLAPADKGAHHAEIGEAWLALFALRSQSAGTLRRLGGGERLGPEISVDKLLMTAAEQTTTDVARRLLWPDIDLDDGPVARHWRRRWAYSRITSIYGGAAEVQHDLVGERLLGLPRGR